MNYQCPRCGKGVDEHEAGRCLDEWFYSVMNDGEELLPSMLYTYSTSMVFAMEGLEQFTHARVVKNVAEGRPGWPADASLIYWVSIGMAQVRSAFADTLQLAIVRACIKAKEDEK